MKRLLDVSEFHWLLTILQSIDVGVVVFDRQFSVLLWNSFMENRSGRVAQDARGQDFFKLFPEVDEPWFRQKVEGVTTMGMPSFTVWEQRPYLVRFKNYQPITGYEAVMYQNTTLLPLESVSGEIEYLCLIIYDVTDVASNRKQLQKANAQLAMMSRTDRLTSLYNRGYWEELLELELSRFQRYQGSASLVMLDIDHFKRINDTYGHLAGDEVIRQVARTIKRTVRDTDLAGRYGGEEFGVILLDTGAEQGVALAERIRLAMAEQTVHFEGVTINFTISLGVAELNLSVSSAQDWLKKADSALYDSKRDGRNRTTLFSAATLVANDVE